MGAPADALTAYLASVPTVPRPTAYLASVPTGPRLSYIAPLPPNPLVAPPAPQAALKKVSAYYRKRGRQEMEGGGVGDPAPGLAVLGEALAMPVPPDPDTLAASALQSLRGGSDGGGGAGDGSGAAAPSWAAAPSSRLAGLSARPWTGEGAYMDEDRVPLGAVEEDEDWSSPLDHGA